MGKKRILLIEDDRGLQVALRYLLEDLGYDLVIAADRAQANVAICDGPYDAAIIDYFLDNIPSSDLIAQLRKRYPATPLVCSTGAFAEIATHLHASLKRVVSEIIKSALS